VSLFLPQRTRLETCLERIAQHEWKVQAFAYLRPADELREEAGLADERLAAGRQLSRLDGMPIGVKDIIDTAGIFTECGSRVTEGRLPERDAEVVRRLHAAGVILLGKLRTHEFAMGTRTPPTRNGIDSERSPGGSSGGSGAALASEMVEGALGTDTGGSIRIPASYNGIVGLKPTPGIVSLEGVFPLCPSLDVAGPMGPDVATVEALLRVIGDVGGQQPFALPEGRPLRVGVPRRFFCEGLQEPVELAFEYGLGVLRDAGWELVEVAVPSAPRVQEIQFALFFGEVLKVHAGLFPERAALYTETSRRYLETAVAAPPERYAWACEQRELVRADVAAALAGVDVLATPTTPFTAPPHDAWALLQDGDEVPIDLPATRNVAIFNQSPTPALSLPCAADGDGLPIGLQLVAAPQRDLFLLGVAAEVERLLAEAFRSMA
jgi:aspartyl-tRNA(Asn)/glutamyl-tRNA(Gln) amidotransferase subunit A